MSIRLSRGTLCLLLLSALLPACDNNSELSDISLNINVEGTGSGSIAGRTVGVHIECNVTDGVTSGSCSDAFQDSDGGTVRLEASPDVVTNFSWGADCRRAAGRLCELSYTAGEDVVFDVLGRFDSKTVKLIISPKPITLTEAGQEVVATAQALDENDAEVFGVSYTWTTSNASIVTVEPLTNSRQAVLTAIADGSAIVSATAQGVTGQTQVDISVKN